MPHTQLARKSFALLMGLLLLFTCVLPAAAAPSDGLIASDAQLSSDGAAAALPSDGNGTEASASPAASDGGVVTQADTALSSDGDALLANTGNSGKTVVRYATGYIDDGWAAPLLDESRLQALLADDTLPSAYSLKDTAYLTPVRNQGVYGTCWAHAALASAESNLLMQGEEAEVFSVLHLANYTYRRNETVTQILGTTGDTVAPGQGVDVMQNGGNDTIAVSTLAAGLGPVLENALPYTNDAYVQAVRDGSLDANEWAVARNAGPQFEYAYVVNLDNPDAVKHLLMTCGAASISYYTPEDGSDDGYHFGETTSYYQNTETITDHAVTLCGWDDEYSRDNFASDPGADGAWLCKNSWGTNWGDEGFFYISYEDSSLENVCFYGMKPAGEGYDNIYQHDGGVTFSFSIYDVTQMAGVFTARGKESLEAVRVRLRSTDNDITLRAYKGVENPEDPTSGTEFVQAVQSHYCPYAGTYTLSFKEPVPLEKGEEFSVVVQVEGSAEIPFDSPSASGSTISAAVYSERTFFDPGSGFDNFTEGQDLHIKALTNDSKRPGDVNENGRLDLADAVLAARIAVGGFTATPAQRLLADVVHVQNEQKGAVTVRDVRQICLALVKPGTQLEAW